MAPKKKFSLIEFILRLLGLWRESKPGAETADSAAIVDTTDAAEFPYHLRDDFLSPAEFSFYSVLRETVGNQSVICVKVSLSDLFWVKREDSSKHRVYTNKIDRKHVDFLLCHPGTMKPLVGIELDDKSHQREDRKQRDRFVDGVFHAAGLPLVHVPVKRGYVTNDMLTLLSPYLAVTAPIMPPSTVEAARFSSKAPVSQPHVQANGAPRCPKCNSEMTLRTVKKGEHAGKRFWGCTSYPNCRTMLPYTQPTLQNV